MDSQLMDIWGMSQPFSHGTNGSFTLPARGVVNDEVKQQEEGHVKLKIQDDKRWE